MQAYSTSHQIYTFLAVMYTGFLSACIEDILRPLCNRCSKIFQWLMDAFICAVSALMLFLSLYLTGSSSLRLYMAAAFLLGVAVYHASLHRLFHTFLKSMMHFKRKTDAGGE